MDIYKYDLSRSQWEALIDEYIFDERDRKILKRRLLDGVRYESLAEEFRLSTRYTQKVVEKCEKQLFKHI